jgi:hypothetical protein
MYMKKASTIMVKGPPFSVREQAKATTNAAMPSEALSRVVLGYLRLAGTGMRPEPTN